MSKFLEIKLKDDLYKPDLAFDIHDNNGPRLFTGECPNIMKKFTDDNGIIDYDLEKAIDTIIAHFASNAGHTMIVDVFERDKALAPPKEMTLEEIEKELGYKVKVISEKEE